MIRTINRTQIRSKIQGFIEDNFGTPAAERVCFLEIGPVDRYQKVHIPKAIQMDPNFTEHEMRNQASSYLPSHATEIIIYGDQIYQDRVKYAAEVLSQAGFANIFVYEDGKEDWLKSGLWTETTWVLADQTSREESAPLKKVS